MNSLGRPLTAVYLLGRFLLNRKEQTSLKILQKKIQPWIWKNNLKRGCTAWSQIGVLTPSCTIYKERIGDNERFIMNEFSLSSACSSFAGLSVAKRLLKKSHPLGDGV